MFTWPESNERFFLDQFRTLNPELYWQTTPKINTRQYQIIATEKSTFINTEWLAALRASNALGDAKRIHVGG